MSNAALNWAWEQQIEAGPKFVLIAVADLADAAGYAWPSQATLSAMTGQGERTVRRHLRWNEINGIIRRTKRFSASGWRTSDLLQICFDTAKFSPAATFSADCEATDGQLIPSNRPNQVKSAARMATDPSEINHRTKKDRGNAPVGREPSRTSTEPSNDKKPTTPWPADFVLTPQMRLFAAARGLRPEEEFERWKEICLAHGRWNSDWPAAWRAACVRAVKARSNPRVCTHSKCLPPRCRYDLQLRVTGPSTESTQSSEPSSIGEVFANFFASVARRPTNSIRGVTRDATKRDTKPS